MATTIIPLIERLSKAAYFILLGLLIFSINFLWVYYKEKGEVDFVYIYNISLKSIQRKTRTL